MTIELGLVWALGGWLAHVLWTWVWRIPPSPSTLSASGWPLPTPNTGGAPVSHPGVILSTPPTPSPTPAEIGQVQRMTR